MKIISNIISNTGIYSIYSFAALILTCHPSLGSMESEEMLPPWAYRLKVCEPDGKLIQEQLAYNPVYLHGFDKAHQQGIKGQGVSIAFLEEGVDQNHPQLKPDQIDVIDCTQYEEIIGTDKAIYRHNREFSFRRLGLTDRTRSLFCNQHGNHVMGVALGQARTVSYTTNVSFILNDPQTSLNDGGRMSFDVTVCTAEHPGGCCPEARGILYTFSTYYHQASTNYGSACHGISILSIEQAKKLNLLNTLMRNSQGYQISLEEYYGQLQPPLTPEEETFINEEPIDKSPITALQEALTGPSFAINWSFTPWFLMDPTNSYKAPMDLLNYLGEQAEVNDKIIIFCANNDSECLEQKIEAEFYNQILLHPILSQRVIFSVNVCPTTMEDEMKIGELNINNQRIPFKLYYSSNYPGESLKSLCLSAVGSNIISGYNKDGVQRGSGTSEAAPVIASLATLVKQRFPAMSGPQVIQRLKETALPLGESKFTGCGYVWAPAALDLIMNEG
jgi:hypothetical protein